MPRPEKHPKASRKEGKSYLHLEVNPEARHLFRIHAMENHSTMTEILHQFICRTIGREDLPAPSECNSEAN